jgi:hypothetical protein
MNIRSRVQIRSAGRNAGQRKMFAPLKSMRGRWFVLFAECSAVPALRF